ncbi:MAG TPA: hypothetical protein VLM91_28165 [Candidatus Methylomirabilis sp.]|nr:hypothetical protein [Candidatus Methylomirabilis sp.]
MAILEDGVAPTSDRREIAGLRRMQQMGAEVVSSDQDLSCAAEARFEGVAG